MRISVELVPRNKDVLEQELNILKEKFPVVETVNIPDLLRLDIRAWEGCTFAQKFIKTAIPHIRSIDFHLDHTDELFDYIRKHQLKEVLVVTGDPPPSIKHKIFRTRSIQLIKKMRAEMPELKIYAALDPYRSSIKDELEYAERKLNAGADGLFTQPFFDLRLMEIYADQLKHTEVFWGISPVLTEQSQNYWETRNNVVFPADFRPDMEWNKDFARKALAFAKKTDDPVYFMPIRTNLEQYLDGLF